MITTDRGATTEVGRGGSSNGYLIEQGAVKGESSHHRFGPGVTV